MLKNKDFRRVLVLGSAVTVIFAACGFIFAKAAAGALILVTGAILIALFSHYTKERYAAIEALNDYLTGVLAGRESPHPDDQEEGELSILRSNIYKAAGTLTHQKDLLAGDKKRLAAAIADISHQLKTPLTSMMVMNDLLVGEEDPDRQKDFLKTQSDQLDRMNWLIQTLLKLSKIDAGVVTMKQEKISARDLIAAAIKPFEIQMELMEMKTSAACDDLPLMCDINWTIEALQNIIKNCYEHMAAGGVLKIETEDTNLFSRIKITDSGCGISEADLPHIFERFYKGKNAGKDSVGIGLALSKAVMESQRGDILVKSEEGVGTEFDVRFYKTIV